MFNQIKQKNTTENSLAYTDCLFSVFCPFTFFPPRATPKFHYRGNEITKLRQERKETKREFLGDNEEA
jgi:hypothetical protein